MSELSELYQEVILDHNRRPRNKRPLLTDLQAEGYNPLCGDRVTVYIDAEGDTLREVTFEGAGCAISTASASLMTERLKGATRAEAEALIEQFHAMVTGQPRSDDGPDLGKLEALSNVHTYPMRVKCASLAWHTLKAALKGEQEKVSTE